MITLKLSLQKPVVCRSKKIYIDGSGMIFVSVLKKFHMKKIIASLLMGSISLLALESYGQAQNIPASVSNHFKTTYPGAQEKDWDTERDGTYEVEFMLNGQEWEATYAANGAWLKTERDVTRAEVPQAVLDALSKSEYSAWKTDDMEEHQTPQHKSVYEIEVKKGFQKSYLYFLPNGKMVQ